MNGENLSYKALKPLRYWGKPGISLPDFEIITFKRVLRVRVHLGGT